MLSFSAHIHSSILSFELSPDEVVKFCTNCVMGGEEEECEIPDAFYNFIDDFGYEQSTEEKS